jgi:hypothetical protein
MHIHILGICGTFMGGIAAIAKQAGHKVTGCDANVYPPMSTQLEAQGIELIEGWDPKQIELSPDLFVIGNVVSRGNPLMEAILDRNLPYVSGPQWLYEDVLRDKWVLGVAGTHGKTTTTAMLAWILEDAGLNPGFLIGGVPENFGISARLTASPFFAIEADEYDTAFFDKRSKFVHYHPRTVILNNLEFDHADIFADLAAIETQFHHLVRTIPGNGLIVANGLEDSIERVLARGCWTPVERVGLEADWHAGTPAPDGSFDVRRRGALQGTVRWELQPQPPQCAGRSRRGPSRGRAAGARDRGARAFPQCQAAAGAARHGERHQRLRRLCAPPHGHRADDSRPAQQGPRGAHPRGARAAFQYHEDGCHEGHPRPEPEGRGPRVLLHQRPGMGCPVRAVSTGSEGRRP